MLKVFADSPKCKKNPRSVSSGRKRPIITEDQVVDKK